MDRALYLPGMELVDELRAHYPDPGSDPFFLLVARIERVQAALLTHPLYQRVNNLPALRVFMRSHVFAVWDFMTLAKSLQAHLTCLDRPWLPPKDIVSARLINDIVLGEESDEVRPGVFTSHYDLYLQAMMDVGADVAPMKRFEGALRQGVDPAQALVGLDVPEPTKDFVVHTLRTAEMQVHEVAAAFLMGREDVIPRMFQSILDSLDRSEDFGVRVVTGLERAERRLPDRLRGRVHGRFREAIRRVQNSTGIHDPRANLRLYLERHIELDGEHHGPMGERLLRVLCGNDDRKWEEAFAAAQSALEVRVAFWDGIFEEISGGPAKRNRNLRPGRARIRSGSGGLRADTDPDRRGH